MGVEDWWNDTEAEKPKDSEEKSVTVTLYPPRISYGMAWNRIRGCAVRDR
jgi:hypothetical protein